MAFTDHCDLFASFHEDGFNAIVRDVRQQRPSLFNYASLGIIANPALLCRQIDAHPVVALRGNPLMTKIDPLPIPGTNYAMELAVQVTDAKIDFHPGNVIALPPQLGKLAPQRLAIGMGVCIGLGCPRDFPLDRLIEPPQDKPTRDDKGERAPADLPKPLPTRSLLCFCFQVFAVGGVRIRYYNGKPYLEPFLDGRIVRHRRRDRCRLDDDAGDILDDFERRALKQDTQLRDQGEF
ncbi:MAG: hypothetical protein KGI75_31410 [Rhizobiaceae bacterium]|nr:hypothetical protein [Rhizobiaceae bacterium]